MVLRKLTMTTAMTSSTMALLYASTLVLAADICNQVVTCRKNGGTECNRKNQACPPCIYTLADTYTCWEKDNVTNTCPFTGVKYDCSTAWATTTTNTTTAPTATATTNKSKLIMYAAIGGGALLLILLLVVIFCVRRRRRARNMPQFGMHSPQAFHTKRGGAKSAQSANTPYAYSNGPTTGKGGANYHPHHQRKHSDPVLLESSAVNVGHSNDYDTSTNTTSDSLDAMLTDNTPPTAVLGDPPLPKTRSKRGLSRGFSRLNSGGSSRRGSTTDKISRNDVPSTRYTATHHTNANVLDEYLKMKQEMHFDSDAVSDYVSDTMSDRFSLQSSSTIGGTESEYLGDLMRSRTESECYSEMSYNDEKYSFSEDDADSVLGASAVSKKKVDKEVEI